MTAEAERIAIWALTAKGAALGQTLRKHFPASRLFCNRRSSPAAQDITRFERLKDALPQHFHDYCGHVFIMATGIVVRSLVGRSRGDSRSGVADSIYPNCASHFTVSASPRSKS